MKDVEQHELISNIEVVLHQNNYTLYM